ncbi:MAG: radical SAM family heme chaperone HemW [Planctomycetota bacterium]|nr:radical SAM family heme chaperone HemW [Planctomycetota bacterium]
MRPSVYVHIPFCETKCPYCDFNSFAAKGRDVDGYLDALAREMDARGVERTPPTLFIGGGTPTVVTETQLARYLTDITARLDPDPDREFTVEANPGSLTREKVAILVEHGVNRVSLGAQSFFQKHLRTLGRVHEVADIEKAYRMIVESGIDNVNLDLIHSVPGLTRHEWIETLDRALDLRPPHLACYALIFEPGTEFFARRTAGTLKPVDENLELSMFRWTERRLARAGLRRYEISNFARPGRECRHNLRYWRNETYLGFGAGAFSFVGGERLGNERHLERYAERVLETGSAVISCERLAAEKAAAESMVLGLRMSEGADLDEIGRRHGLDARALFAPTVERLSGGGFLVTGERVRLARRGWRVADTVMAEFL